MLNLNYFSASLVVLSGLGGRVYAASALRGLRFFQILRMVRMDRRWRWTSVSVSTNESTAMKFSTNQRPINWHCVHLLPEGRDLETPWNSCLCSQTGNRTERDGLKYLIKCIQTWKQKCKNFHQSTDDLMNEVWGESSTPWKVFEIPHLKQILRCCNWEFFLYVLRQLALTFLPGTNHHTLHWVPGSNLLFFCGLYGWKGIDELLMSGLWLVCFTRASPSFG